MKKVRKPEKHRASAFWWRKERGARAKEREEDPSEKMEARSWAVRWDLLTNQLSSVKEPHAEKERRRGARSCGPAMSAAEERSCVPAGRAQRSAPGSAEQRAWGGRRQPCMSRAQPEGFLATRFCFFITNPSFRSFDWLFPIVWFFPWTINSFTLRGYFYISHSIRFWKPHIYLILVNI